MQSQRIFTKVLRIYYKLITSIDRTKKISYNKFKLSKRKQKLEENERWQTLEA